MNNRNSIKASDSKFDADRGLWLVGVNPEALPPVQPVKPRTSGSQRRLKVTRNRTRPVHVETFDIPGLPMKHESLLLSVVDQVTAAFQKKNRVATVLGFFLGGVVPFLTFMVAHFGLDRNVDFSGLCSQVCSWIVLGGLLYSATTVFDWGKRAFQKPVKALGFVVLMEGVMTMVPESLAWLAYVPLVFLIAINGIATGCNLSLDRKASR